MQTRRRYVLKMPTDPVQAQLAYRSKSRIVRVRIGTARNQNIRAFVEGVPLDRVPAAVRSPTRLHAIQGRRVDPLHGVQLADAARELVPILLMPAPGRPACPKVPWVQENLSAVGKSHADSNTPLAKTLKCLY